MFDSFVCLYRLLRRFQRIIGRISAASSPYRLSGVFYRNGFTGYIYPSSLDTICFLICSGNGINTESSDYHIPFLDQLTLLSLKVTCSRKSTLFKFWNQRLIHRIFLPRKFKDIDITFWPLSLWVNLGLQPSSEPTVYTPLPLLYIWSV